MEDYNVGKHCQIQICRQKDWLPIRCKYCCKTYCADHSSIDSHDCRCHDKAFRKVYTCPLCNRNLELNSNISVQDNFAIHEATACLNNYAENTKPDVKCEGNKCRSKLTEINKHQCKYCRKKLCLKHRMPEEHKCCLN